MCQGMGCAEGLEDLPGKTINRDCGTQRCPTAALLSAIVEAIQQDIAAQHEQPTGRSNSHRARHGTQKVASASYHI